MFGNFNLEAVMSKAGTQISNLSGDAAYKSFRPSPLPPELNIDDEMLSYLTGATKALATSSNKRKLNSSALPIAQRVQNWPLRRPFLFCLIIVHVEV